jgi:uncharacterized membrane protein YedE/YeeE
MTLPAKVASFLSPTIPAWDATLAFVMASAMSISLLAYQVGYESISGKCRRRPHAQHLHHLQRARHDSLSRVRLPSHLQSVLGRLSLLPPEMQLVPSNPSINTKGAPVLVKQYTIPSSSIVDTRLMTGAVMFGTGWGLTGICPGPAIVSSVAAALGGQVPWASSLSAQVLPYMVGLVAGMYLEPFALGMGSSK